MCDLSELIFLYIEKVETRSISFIKGYILQHILISRILRMNQGLSGKRERVVGRSVWKIEFTGTSEKDRESGERVKGDTEGSWCGALVATGAVRVPP